MEDAPRTDGRGVYRDRRGNFGSTRGGGATETGMAEGESGDAGDTVPGKVILARRKKSAIVHVGDLKSTTYGWELMED